MYGVMAQNAINPSSSGQYVTQRIAPTVAPAAARKPKPKAKHKPKAKGGVPGINQYLAGDTTYQDQASQLMKQLEDYQTSNASDQSIANQDYGTALERMMKQRTADTSNLTGDYASRGILNSGLFTKAVGDYNTNYQNQVNDLNTTKSRTLSQLLEDLQNYSTENRSALASAKQDAIRRRAQQYGITV